MARDHSLTTYLVSIHDCPRFTGEEEAELHARMKAGDAEARELLIRAVLPWAILLAKRWQGRGIDLEDLVQMANLGAIRAVDKFDPALGRLTTVATLQVRAALGEGVQNQKSVVHVPRYVQEGKGPEEYLEAGRVAHAATVSLSNSGGIKSDHGEAFWSDMIEAPPYDHDEHQAHGERLLRLDRAIEALPERERHVIRGRLAEKTLEEVGAELGVTKERVRQIQCAAHQRLEALYLGAPTNAFRRGWGLSAPPPRKKPPAKKPKLRCQFCRRVAVSKGLCPDHLREQRQKQAFEWHGPELASA